LRLSERRATNIGLLYPKVRNNIGWDIPVDVPPTKILGGCVPGIPGGVDASEHTKVRIYLTQLSTKLHAGTTTLLLVHFFIMSKFYVYVLT